MPTKQAPTLQKPKGAWREFRVIIAIDPGKKTGYASYYPKETVPPGAELTVYELPIWEVFERLKMFAFADDVFVLLEDARKNYRPKSETDEGSDARKMGAGWIRTLSGLYEDFLKAHKIAYRLKRKGVTKLTADQFKSITRIETKAGEHNARDAGMMAWQHPFLVYVESNGY